MELILTCKQCGHVEKGSTERALMAKVRMHNHLNRAHREEAALFTAAVEEYAQAATTQNY